MGCLKSFAINRLNRSKTEVVGVMNGSSSSESVEMYLKSVAELGGEDEPVPIGLIAGRLDVSPASASEMMKRLSEQELVYYEPYKGITLASRGREIANLVIRKQRLWECFLVDYLKLDWARVHELACDLEHATAGEVAEALAIFLDHPTKCPHGNPIPDAKGETELNSAVPLSSLKVGQISQVQAVVPQEREILNYLANRKLLPGQEVMVLDVEPLHGPLTLQVGQEKVMLGQNIARLVLVELVQESEKNTN
jgi:DtxR family Mn-dependent transcriptional regulator